MIIDLILNERKIFSMYYVFCCAFQSLTRPMWNEKWFLYSFYNKDEIVWWILFKFCEWMHKYWLTLLLIVLVLLILLIKYKKNKSFF